MKILVVGDVHWCQYSSILRSRGSKYSRRLELLIDTINYAESIPCDRIVYLGDFFDRADVNAEELSALSKIRWINRRRYVLAGNHEMGGNYSSANLLKLIPDTCVITSPETIVMDDGSICHFLPYISEDNRRGISEYLKETNCSNKPIIFSHNDIKGIQMGKFISKQGFDIQDILDNSTLFINGHLHNGNEIVDKRIINLGNISGQNFSEDATKYPHRFMLLDSCKIQYEYVGNPYAINFYKLEGLTKDNFSAIIDTVGDNAVASLQIVHTEPQEKVQKCGENWVEKVRKCADEKFIAYRLTEIFPKSENKIEQNESVISTDHIKDFNDFIMSECSEIPYIAEELQEITT